MLTARQNLIETMKKDGHPDRFVKQCEAYGLVMGNPLNDPRPVRGGAPVVNKWGVTKVFQGDTPGAFPINDDAHVVVKDIEHWRDYVHAPNFKFSDAEWEPFQAAAEKIDRNEKFCLVMIAPGLFEQCHYLCEIKNCLIYLYENPDEMRDLIKYLTEYELTMAEAYCHYLKPEGVFHHDDWGTQQSTFMSPDMFADFYEEPIKEIYGYYKSNGASLVVHHSDSYAASLVPFMIDAGINIWQGALDTNDIPALLDKYGDQITIHGGLNNGKYDKEDWTREEVHAGLKELFDSTHGGKHLIAGLCGGGPGSTYPGVYEVVDEEIDALSKEYFK